MQALSINYCLFFLILSGNNLSSVIISSGDVSCKISKSTNLSQLISYSDLKYTDKFLFKCIFSLKWPMLHRQPLLWLSTDKPIYIVYIVPLIRIKL